MKKPEYIFIGVAWPYANGSLHAGHFGGAYLPPDVFARFQRLQGNKVLMVSGTDSHGTPITVRADKEGVTPQEIVDRYHAEFSDVWRRLSVKFDFYTTTRTEEHRLVVQDIFQILLNKGYLFEGDVPTLIDPQSNRSLPDRYVEGECPFCGYKNARGDQCESCGKLLEAFELKHPRSIISGATPTRSISRHFFLDLPQFEGALLEWANGQTHWRPNVRASTLRFLEGGLRPRAITRDLEWGVPVPNDGNRSRRIYVWFEAVCGYLSASRAWADATGSPEAWKEWWHNPESRHYYFIGKDNIPFHTVIWPAILLGVGGLQLPYDIPANEFVNFDGEKASKSRGIGATLPDLLAHFEGDAIRFYSASILPETGDSTFSIDDLITRVNTELVANWGNLTHRTLTLVQKLFDGNVPDHDVAPEIEAEIQLAFDECAEALGAVRLKVALRRALKLSQFANQYLHRAAPWSSQSDDERRNAVGNCLQLVSAIKTLLYPFLPSSSTALHRQLGETSEIEEQGWHWTRVPVGRHLLEPVPLFKKIDARTVSR